MWSNIRKTWTHEQFQPTFSCCRCIVRWRRPTRFPSSCEAEPRNDRRVTRLAGDKRASGMNRSDHFYPFLTWCNLQTGTLFVYVLCSFTFFFSCYVLFLGQGHGCHIFYQVDTVVDVDMCFNLIMTCTNRYFDQNKMPTPWRAPGVCSRLQGSGRLRLSEKPLISFKIPQEVTAKRTTKNQTSHYKGSIGTRLDVFWMVGWNFFKRLVDQKILQMPHKTPESRLQEAALKAHQTAFIEAGHEFHRSSKWGKHSKKNATSTYGLTWIVGWYWTLIWIAKCWKCNSWMHGVIARAFDSRPCSVES